MKFAHVFSVASFGLLFAAMPSSTNYQLHNYGYGSGGTSNSTSTNYGLNATTGELSNQQSSSTNYRVRAGNQNSQQANVPTVTITNPANYYNRLNIVINTSSNPSDTLYSVAISTDNFATTQYVQPDATVGPTRSILSYQSYAAWGGAGGMTVNGLAASTTYYVKVNAFQGRFTETEYGPVSSAATAAPSITFDIDVSPTDTSTNPPYVTAIGTLLPNTVVTDPDRIWVRLDTNAVSGGAVYIRSANGGLSSVRSGHTIASATADLNAVSTGYGAQGASASQTSGGPFSTVTPFNGGGQSVGVLGTILKPVFTTSAPIVNGRGSLYLKAKVSAQTPSANDYADILTLTAAGAF